MKRINFVLVILILAILPFSLMAAKKNGISEELNSKTSGSSKTVKKQSIQAEKGSVAKKPVNDSESRTTKLEPATTDIVDNNANTPVLNSPQTGEQITWQVFSSGATDASSTSYHLFGTLGQVAVGTVVSTSYSLHQGYWQDFGSGGGGCCGQYVLGGFTGNTNCDVNGKRNLADITVLIDHVYISKAELCCNENGNTNGDIDEKRNLADITLLIDHVYISKDEIAACL